MQVKDEITVVEEILHITVVEEILCITVRKKEQKIKETTNQTPDVYITTHWEEVGGERDSKT